jgi:hypothetical protein
MADNRDRLLDRYTLKQICALLDKAAAMGLPLYKGSYVEQMTIRELEELVNGKTQA